MTPLNDISVLEQPELTAALHMMRPSEYTATLIQALLGMRSFLRDKSVLEIGSGSGVVLAAIAEMGAQALCGIDVENDALAAGRCLLESVGAGGRGEFHLGNLWQPVAGRQFDLIVANLPHFPTRSDDFPGRRTSWSHGGPDGRRLLDPFLDGLATHLAPGGRAVITHNGFVDLAQTRRILAAQDLSARIARTTLLAMAGDKLDRMCPEIRSREKGRTILSIGPYCFARMHILDIRATKATN